MTNAYRCVIDDEPIQVVSSVPYFLCAKCYRTYVTKEGINKSEDYPAWLKELIRIEKNRRQREYDYKKDGIDTRDIYLSELKGDIPYDQKA